MARKKIIILGSTGSIGTQALDVVREHPERFEVVAMSANNNAALLAQQALEFPGAETVCAFNDPAPLIDLVTRVEANMVLVAVTGAAGLEPTLAAIRAGKDIALANKEALVMAGQEVMAAVKEHGVDLIPVDSEHSAIFQCLQGVKTDEVEKIILTCSGGALYGKSHEELAHVTAKDALKHPTWSMGNKITIDSATLVNKGFEVVEAHHLFGLSYDQIEVRVHPQSIVHGLVQLKDGNTIAHLSPPSMKLPIQYALTYPERVPSAHPRANLWDTTLTFEKPDHQRFPGIELVRKHASINPRRLVEENDRAVEDFLKGEISFLEIYDRLREV